MTMFWKCWILTLWPHFQGRGWSACKIFATMLLHSWFHLIWYATWPCSAKVWFWPFDSTPMGRRRGGLRVKYLIPCCCIRDSIYSKTCVRQQLSQTEPVIDNSYTVLCPPVRGDKPRGLASELSPVPLDNHGIRNYIEENTHTTSENCPMVSINVLTCIVFIVESLI